MTSTTAPTAPFSTRSSISSLWSNRHSRAKPSATSTANAAKNASGSISEADSKTNGLRTHEASKKRDEEAEMWGVEAGMGIGAARPVKSDKDEELRGRILGKRRREVDGKGNEAKGKGNRKGEVDGAADSDSEEEVGRSALGRKKKRRVGAEPSSGSGTESSWNGKTGQVKGETDTQVKAGDEGVTGDEEEWEGIKSSPLAEALAPSDGTKSSRKKKKKKKKRKAAE